MPNPQSSFPPELISIWLQQAKDYAVIVIDPHGIISAWLGAAEEILGYTSGEAVGRSISTIFTHEDRARGFDQYELEVARLNSRSEDERWHVRKDGVRIWASGTVSALTDSGGAVLGFVKVLRDRTDVRARIYRLEAELADLNSRRERTHEFLRTLGHELRNPLAPLSNARHIIERVSSDPKARAAARVIENQVETLTRLTTDLVDVARLEQGKLALNLEPLDLRELLLATLESLAPVAAAKDQLLQPILAPAPLWVNADRLRFPQVVMNLLSNSIRYTPRGGRVWLKAIEEGSDVVFRVEDTGIGMSPETLPRIFDLFTRDTKAQEMAPGGLGVGLALVRQLIELHGGTVQARSAGVGKGSEFSVRLPRANT